MSSIKDFILSSVRQQSNLIRASKSLKLTSKGKKKKNIHTLTTSSSNIPHSFKITKYLKNRSLHLRDNDLRIANYFFMRKSYYERKGMIFFESPSKIAAKTGLTKRQVELSLDRFRYWFGYKAFRKPTEEEKERYGIWGRGFLLCLPDKKDWHKIISSQLVILWNQEGEEAIKEDFKDSKDFFYRVSGLKEVKETEEYLEIERLSINMVLSEEDRRFCLWYLLYLDKKYENRSKWRSIVRNKYFEKREYNKFISYQSNCACGDEWDMVSKEEKYDLFLSSGGKMRAIQMANSKRYIA